MTYKSIHTHTFDSKYDLTQRLNAIGQSRTAIARFMGIDRTTLWRYENGNTKIPAIVWIMLREIEGD